MIYSNKNYPKENIYFACNSYISLFLFNDSYLKINSIALII